MQADWIINNVNLATMQEGYGNIDAGLLAVQADRIVWFGPQREAPAFAGAAVIDGHGGWLTPGLIDCHTHLIYGGNRALEFEQRLQGKSYSEIALAGGGINSTVTATRQASDQTLQASALHRLQQLQREGVTTVEIKSGYGLDLENELRLLAIAKSLAQQLPITLRTTYLGAHAVPPDYKSRSDDYIDFICRDVLPQVAEQQLADAVDVFCEGVGFTLDQCRQVFTAATDLGLRIKGHVEQLSYQGGARLVAEFNGLSVDHLEYLPPDDIPLLKAHNVVAVLLPAAFYYLRETQRPPIAAMREAGLAMAVASDCNPGSAPMASLLLAMNQACLLFGLTPAEALAGTTRHAAQALGLQHCKGQLAVGYDADLLLWDIQHPAELSYSINMHRPQHIWVGGRDVHSA